VPNRIARDIVRKWDVTRAALTFERFDRSNDLATSLHSNKLSSNSSCRLVTLMLSSCMFAAATALPALCSPHLAATTRPSSACARLPQDSTTPCRFPIRPSLSLRHYPSSRSSEERHPKPHIKTTSIMLASTAAAGVISGLALNADYVVECIVAGWIAFWARKILITDDYDRAAKAAADAERVREEARRRREAQRVPEPSIAYLYSIFGLPQNATDAEIRTAYRRLVTKYHPDRSKYSSAANAEMFRQVQEAYAELRAMRGSWVN
jgi:hypothetical protein